jgi:hypothetical protein
MNAAGHLNPNERFLSKAAFAGLFDLLHRRGFQVIGPTVDHCRAAGRTSRRRANTA